MYETHTTVVGTLITPLNRRWLADGTCVVSFRVASNARRYDRASDGWVDGDRVYLSVTCWRRLAENVFASFTTGDPIVVHGRIYTRNYDKDGQRHSIIEMEALAVGPDLMRCTAAVTRTKRATVPASIEGESNGRGSSASDEGGHEGGEGGRDDAGRGGSLGDDPLVPGGAPSREAITEVGVTV
ncbi:MAG: single-stranded DNA-binding protein [Pseudonocardia sp.]